MQKGAEVIRIVQDCDAAGVGVPTRRPADTIQVSSTNSSPRCFATRRSTGRYSP